MAQPSTLVVDLRSKITALRLAMQVIPSLLERYNDLGGKEFVERYLKDEQGQSTTDITGDEFVTAMANLEALQVFLDENRRAALMKMLL